MKQSVLNEVVGFVALGRILDGQPRKERPPRTAVEATLRVAVYLAVERAGEGHRSAGWSEFQPEESAVKLEIQGL